MKKNNPFLPGISTKLEGKSRRRQLEDIQNRLRSLRDDSIADLGVLFSGILPIEMLLDAEQQVRSRLFPEVITFWAWMSQLLESNASCAKALTRVQNWYDSADLPVPAFDTSAYCRARGRLSGEFLDVVEVRSRSYTEARIEGHHLWYGYRLKAIDGTSVKLLDTPPNQKEYPQPSTQKPGCGYPVMGVAGVLDLATGRIETHAAGDYREHDTKGLYKLCDHFGQDDLLIADRAYGSYELIALLLDRGTQSVMRLHQKREGKIDWRCGKKLGADSRLIVWKKPPGPGKCGITEAEWSELPDTMELRLVRTKRKGRDGKMRTLYIVTTLIDAEEYPSEEIAWLYAERWKIEVKFRDIKTTMNLEMLRVKSPKMARKSMRMACACYNLVKSLQMEALVGEPVVMDEIGFKGTLDLINEFRNQFRGLQTKPRLLAGRMEALEERIIERILHIRPGRSEPRATKLRPKSYHYLTKPRSEFIEIPHRNHYRAAA